MNKLPSPPIAIPTDSLIFGYLPMLPFVAGAAGCWLVPSLRDLAIGLTIIWGSLIIAFVGGVRRGFGFGNSRASLRSELWTMALYVAVGGIALILGWTGFVVQAIALLAAGFLLVPVLDYQAARAGNAPAHFAALRPVQMPVAAVALMIMLARVILS